MPYDQSLNMTDSGRRRSQRPVTGPADNSRQFVRARRHTWFVRTLRMTLPIVTIAVIGVYVASAMTSLDLVEKLAQLPIPTINAENVTMDNPRYEGFTKDGGSYVVRARTARQDFKQTELIHLDEISGEMIDARKVKTEMTARRGVLHTKTNELNLLDGIEISSSDGMGAQLKSASIFTKRGVILSKERSIVKLRQGEVASDQLMIWQKQRKATFAGDVRTHLTPPPSDPASAGDADAAQGNGEGNSLLLAGSSNEPVDISSNLLRVEDLKNIASFVGDVRAVQGDQALHSQRLDVFFENEAATASGTSAGAAAAAGRVTRMSSAYPIVITRGDGERITAESLDVDVTKEVAVLSGNVAMVSGSERSARSDKAEIDVRQDTALLTGNVVVTQGTNEIKGQRLLIDRKNGTSLLTSPATPQAAEGRIFARLQRSAGPEAADTASKQSEKGAAGGISAITFKTDPNAPVEVEADELEVTDAQNTAEFRGDVRANQGGFSVRTTKLVAHYSGGGGLLDPAAQDKKAAGEQSSTQLTRISAHGKVLVSSSAGQSATGDWAEFDVAANTVTLGGDVVLTQGKNIIRGTQLKIDMTSGNSVIETGPEAAGDGWASTMQPKGGSASKVQLPGGMGARGGRPSAVFYPTQFKQSEKKGDKSQRNKADSGGAGASSWDATTAPRN